MARQVWVFAEPRLSDNDHEMWVLGEPWIIYDSTFIAGWTGKIAGVTDPAKIAGVDVANIAKVKGVA